MCNVESERHSLTLSVGYWWWTFLQVEQKLLPAESMETDCMNLVEKCLCRHGKSCFLSASKFSRYAKCPQNQIFQKQVKVPKIAIFFKLRDISKKNYETYFRSARVQLANIF